MRLFAVAMCFCGAIYMLVCQIVSVDKLVHAFDQILRGV